MNLDVLNEFGIENRAKKSQLQLSIVVMVYEQDNDKDSFAVAHIPKCEGAQHSNYYAQTSCRWEWKREEKTIYIFLCIAIRAM